MSEHYILDEQRNTIPCDLMTWAASIEDHAARRVDQTVIGEVRVSTMFLGLDHSFGSGPPLLFETMVFGGPLDQEMDRCTTWEQAEAQHAAMCKRVSASQADKASETA
jgi:hypothetical protein